MILSLPLSFPSLLFLLTVGKWFRAIFSNLYAGHQVVAWSVDLCGSTSVVIFFFFLCGFVQILQTFQTLMGVDIVTYDISTYQCMLTVIPFVPGTSFTRATLGANGVGLSSSWPFSSTTSTSASSFSRMWGFFEAALRVVSADP